MSLGKRDRISPTRAISPPLARCIFNIRTTFLAACFRPPPAASTMAGCSASTPTRSRAAICSARWSLAFITARGPFPIEMHKINGVLLWSQGTQENGISFDRHGLRQPLACERTRFAERAVTEGVISLWGNIDPTDRGDTTRFSLSTRWSETDDNSHTRIEAYAIHSTLDLYQRLRLLLVPAAARRSVPAVRPPHDSGIQGGAWMELRFRRLPGGNPRRPAVHATTTFASVCRTPTTRCPIDTLTNDEVDGGQCRRLDGHHREMDTLAAHDGGHSRRLFRRQRRRLQSPPRRFYRSRRPHWAALRNTLARLFRPDLDRTMEFRLQRRRDGQPQALHRAGAVGEDRILHKCGRGFPLHRLARDRHEPQPARRSPRRRPFRCW